MTTFAKAIAVYVRSPQNTQVGYRFGAKGCVKRTEIAIYVPSVLECTIEVVAIRHNRNFQVTNARTVGPALENT